MCIKRSRTSLVAVLALGLSVAPSPAAAAQKGEWMAGLAPSYAFIVLGGQGEPKGGGASAYALLGLSDALALRCSGLWSGHHVAPREDSAGGLYQVANLSLGLQYTFDLISVTPAIEAGVGLLYLRYQGDSAVNLELQFGLGADYWFVDWLAAGAAFHYHAFISNPADYPVYFDAGPRVTVRWR